MLELGNEENYWNKHAVFEMHLTLKSSPVRSLFWSRSAYLLGKKVLYEIEQL